jgi:hypothetical protein
MNKPTGGRTENSWMNSPTEKQLKLIIKIGRWVAKLVAHQLTLAVLWVRIQSSPKKYKNRRHKQRSSQHTLARKKYKKGSI